MGAGGYKVALIGNPNSGKSSLFNSLTGLNQKVGNFPGVTVERKSGSGSRTHTKGVEFIDLPGSYGLYPRRADEWVSYAVLLDPLKQEGIDLSVIVVDASNLRRNLLYATQVIDLGIPVVIALTMMDIAGQRGFSLDSDKLSRHLGVPVVPVNPRSNLGIDELDSVMGSVLKGSDIRAYSPFLSIPSVSVDSLAPVKGLFPALTDYGAIHVLLNHLELELPSEARESIQEAYGKDVLKPVKLQSADIQGRYEKISRIVKDSVSLSAKNKGSAVERLDTWFLHGTWGYLIMLTVLFIMFQAVFWIAEYPMGWIESGFGAFTGWLESRLPDNWLGSLVLEGVVAGLGGILVFVPQIMILFGMVTFLEDTGYMARIGFLTDRLMRKVGLNGKSVMPMISGFACAVPAIMSARNIENAKERLLTILATPLMSCSARLPVYTVLVGLVIPKKNILGFLNLQGLVMLGLYLLGLVVALIMSFLFNLFIKMREKSVFILEMPVYRAPRWKNILLTMIQKARIFVMDAGKVIMVISIVLWALSSFGPSSERESIRLDTEARISEDPGKKASLEAEMKARLLENSYAGLLGRKIEPLIEPLGFDWKIGIALITSFAAREVFVGTMATLYSVGGDPEEDDSTLREKMSAAVRSDGSRVYDLATGVSLMIFYAFAMQCMSTLAIVKKETGGWKWPVIMFLYMTGIAYLLGMFSHWIIGSFNF